MLKLILVRHAAPATDACVAPNQWPLSDAGRQSAAGLAAVLAPFLPAALVSSREAKAAETAALVARQLGLRYTTAPGLHEQARASLGWLSNQEFAVGMAALFARPAEAVFGDESADQAYDRFRAALEVVLAEHPDENVMLVTHGAVMTLLISRAQAGLDPLALWQRLGLPAVAVLSRPGLALEQLVEKVEADGH
jgi:2,3-bisphosphoglycerate-dependent phosphoglycerate mutase